jgi:hypothetical protein
MGEDTIFGVRSAAGQAGGETLVVCSADQQGRVLAQLPSNRRPLSAAGGRILIGDSIPVNGRVVARLLSVKSGAELTVEIPRGFFGAALSSKTLAFLAPGAAFNPSSRSGPSILLLYDPDTGRLIQEAIINVSPVSQLYFKGEKTLVVVPAGTLSFVQVHLDDAVKTGTAVTLSGPEVRSVSHPHANAASGGVQQLVQAYLPSANGNHFFVLPSTVREGVRLVKFDQQGVEIASYRLHIGSGRPERLFASNRTVLSDSTEIVIASVEGSLFVFRRPQ